MKREARNPGQSAPPLPDFASLHPGYAATRIKKARGGGHGLTELQRSVFPNTDESPAMQALFIAGAAVSISARSMKLCRPPLPPQATQVYPPHGRQIGARPGRAGPARPVQGVEKVEKHKEEPRKPAEKLQ
jgi:hypothetical protein